MKKRIATFFLALLLMASLPVSAYAEYKDLFDISQGSIDIFDKTATQGGVTYDHAGAVTVTGSTHDNTISVDVTTDVTVTLDNVNIDLTKSSNSYVTGVWVSSPDRIPVAFGGEAMTVNSTDNATVTVELDGANTLKSGIGQAGLGTEDGNLVIQDSNETAGSLTAVGGSCAAGIGGGRAVQECDYHGEGDGCGNNITITGGTIVATGGRIGGAGIGGGLNGTASNITISGDADVTAKSYGDAVITMSDSVAPGSKVRAKEYYGIPAAIGDGGKSVDILGQSGATQQQMEAAAGAALTPNTDELYCTGTVHTIVVTDRSLETATIYGEQHDWDEGTVIREPEIGVEGEVEYKCLRAAEGCDESWTDIIPALEESVAPAAGNSGYSQPIYEVLTLDGEKLDWEEEENEAVLTITVGEENAVLKIYRLKALADRGIKEIVFKSGLAETVLKLADYSDARMPLSVFHRGAETEIVQP